MRSLPLLLVLLLATLIPASAGHKEVIQVYMRIHIQTAGAGLPESQAVSVKIPPNGEIIQIRTLPEITERELVDIKKTTEGIRLVFNHEGSINLNAVTAQNTGRILVVMINGVVVYAPLIDQQISSGYLDIPHQINPQVVQLLKDTAAANIVTANKK